MIREAQGTLTLRPQSDAHFFFFKGILELSEIKVFAPTVVP